MAQVKIVQPKIGSITVLSQTAESVTVRWNRPAQGEGTFKGFKLYCEACGGTLVYLQDNPATFDIGELQTDGHPGPFDISAVAEGEGDIFVYTDVAEGIGRTVAYEEGTSEEDRSDHFWAEVPVGSTLYYFIRAYPGPGWGFVKWTLNGVDAGTSASYRISYKKQSTAEYTADYLAYFTRLSYRLWARIYTNGKSSSTQPIGGKVNGYSTINVDLGLFPYEQTVTLQAEALPGYRFVRFEVTEGSTEGEGPHVGDVYTGRTWTFPMPASTTRIRAQFESVTGNLLYGKNDQLLYGSNGLLVYEG